MGHNLKKIGRILNAWFETLTAPLLKGCQKIGSFLLGLLKKIPYLPRGHMILGAAVVLFAGAILVWIGYGLFSGIDTPIHTVLAVEYTADAGCSTQGYIVRQEQLLYSNQSIHALALSEGQKVAAGQTVVMGYTSADARALQKQIAALEEKLELLRYAGTGSTADSNAQLDAQIAKNLFEVSALLSAGDLTGLETASLSLKGQVLRRFSDKSQLVALQQAAEETQLEINRLNILLADGVSFVRAPESGYFSAVVDGYESLLTPQNISSLSVSQILALSPATASPKSVGRLITGDKWYYLCVVPSQQLSDVWAGSTVTLVFQGDELRKIPMEVVSLSQEEDGQCALVLSTDRYMQTVTALRQQSGDLIFHSYDGLRVPKEAIQVNEKGATGVFVLEGVHAVWKTVEILYDNGDSYVVKLDKSSTNNLWPGDEILVAAEGLFDGKVVLV